MFYVYAFLIPLVILAIDYGLTTPKPKSGVEWINLLLKALPHEWCYVFFLYYIETAQNISTGYADFGITVFLLPLTGIIILLKLFYWIRSIVKAEKKNQSTVKQSG